MANLTQIRNALAAQIEANTQPYISAVGMPYDQVNVPAALVLPGKPLAQYGVTMGDGTYMGGVPMSVTNFNLNVIILVAEASTKERVQETLDQWLGFENDVDDQGIQVVSVPFAVALDTSLGGVVDYCEPTTVSQYGPIEYNGITYFGATIGFNIGAQ